MDDRDFTHLFQHGKNRKKERKQKRQLKKVVKKAYFSHKNVEEAVTSEFDRKSRKRKHSKPKTLGEKPVSSTMSSIEGELNRFKNKAKKVRSKRMKEEEDDDDKEIKFFMKKLGMKGNMFGSGEDAHLFEGISICQTDNSVKRVSASKAQKKLDQLNEESEVDEPEIEESDNDEPEIEESDNEASGSDENDESDASGSEEEEAQTIEDIYGRKIDAKTGEVVEGVDASKAQKKLDQLNEESDLSEEKRQALTKSIRSIFNRLNQSTLVASVKNLEQLIASNSRNDVKQVFHEIFSKSIATEMALTDRLVIEFSGYLLLVHQLISAEISAYFVEKFTLAYLDMLANEGQERNSLRNSTLLLAQIYNFKVIRAAFLIEIMDKLLSIESPISLTMLTEILTYAGVTLKKRDGKTLNDFILRLQDQLENMSPKKLEDDRISFLVEDLKTTKNAKLAKFTNKFDSSFLEHYQKVIKGLTKQAEKKENELGFSVDDILHVAERGRWWVIGSVFARNSIHDGKSNAANNENASKFDESLLKLAAKLQMSTELRREIFCTIMSATSINDAFETLLKLGKGDHQGRELIYILVVCSLHEREYNPFYANLIERFCEYKRNFQLTAQYAIWDRLKQVDALKKHQRRNLAILIADLIWLDALQLTVLKVINFGMLDEATTLLLKHTMFRLLVKTNEKSLSQLFGRVTRDSSKNELLTHGLQLFFEVSLKDDDFADAEEFPIFKKRLGYVRDLLGISE
ncbi:Nucleolar MIF4G domain-containing protein 1 [Aphelenchoides bicaudatus]|nr:Nucleolar MIF4G domain-containing protein 1 [Aphelenchoides bicaudatus]